MSDAGSKRFSQSNARPNDLPPRYGLGGVGVRLEKSFPFLLFLCCVRLISSCWQIRNTSQRLQWYQNGCATTAFFGCDVRV